MKSVILFLLLVTFGFGSNFSQTLFYGNCTSCHQIDVAKSAPSIIEIKHVYLDIFPKKDDFVEFMSTWIYEPYENTALMPDAVKKYGLMPELGYDLGMLEDIATYIYETDFTKKQ